MKKCILYILLIMVSALTGCGGAEAASSQGSAKSSALAKSNGFVFEHNGAMIELGRNARDVTKEIGAPVKTFESKSCAFDGVDKILYYDGFEINTYPAKGEDYILAIEITDDSSQKTPEGVGLGMTLENITAAYGEQYEEMLGSYTYQKGDVQLTFLLDNNVITDIRYYYTAAENT